MNSCQITALCGTQIEILERNAHLYFVAKNKGQKLDVVSDFPFPQRIAAGAQGRNFIRSLKENTYARLVPLSEENYKLYIHLRLLGGMDRPSDREKKEPQSRALVEGKHIEVVRVKDKYDLIFEKNCKELGISNSEILDDKVKAAIIERVQYKSKGDVRINVETIENYLFKVRCINVDTQQMVENVPVFKKARCITAEISNAVWRDNFWSALKLPPPTENRQDDRIKKALVGSQYPKDKEVLKSCLARNIKLVVYISYDLKGCHIDFLGGRSVYAAERVHNGAVAVKNACSIM